MITAETTSIRTSIRQDLATLAENTRNAPPERWWHTTYANLCRLQRNAANYPPEIRDYIYGQIAYAQQLLAQQLTTRNPNLRCVTGPGAIEHVTEILISDMSRHMSEPFCQKPEMPTTQNKVLIEDIVGCRPDMLLLREGRGGARFIDITHPETHQVMTLLLPYTQNVLYKGGIPRLFVNLVANAPSSMIAAELPWNDLDAIGIGDSTKTRDEALALGVDLEGIEMLGSDRLDWDEYCYGRDTDHNQALLGRKYLHFSTASYNAAQSGHINLIGAYTPNRALYGTDTFTYQDMEFGTPRGLMRLIKPVAEKKALSFSYHPANRHIDCAPYFLFLARKWSTKKNFGELLQRGLEVGRLMGQIPDDMDDPYKTLDVMHARVPLFDLGAQIREPKDVALWKLSKLVREADRELTWMFKFPGDLEVPSEDLEKPSQVIYLNGFTPDADTSAYIENGWNEFVNQCAERVNSTKAQGINPVDRYFLRNHAWMRFLQAK